MAVLVVELIVMGSALYLNPRARRRARLEEQQGEKALDINIMGADGVEIDARDPEDGVRG